MCGFRAPLPGLNAGARPHLQHRSHCHRATAYRRNRGSTFAAINHPSASRNLCQNHLFGTISSRFLAPFPNFRTSSARSGAAPIEVTGHRGLTMSEKVPNS